MTPRTEWSGADLLAHEWPPISWAVPQVFPDGFTLLAGAPKLGKSWLALGLAVAVASGGKAFGTIEVEPGPVLYCALEDTGRRLQQRLWNILGDEPCPPGLTLQLRLNRGVEALQYIREHCQAHRPRLVLIDTLQKIRPPGIRDDPAYGSDYAFAGAIKAVADEYGTAVIGLHHVRKASASDWVDEVSGTNGLAGAADTIVVMRRERGDADAVMHLVGRDVDEADHALRLVDGHWTLLDIPVSHLGMGDGRKEVLRYIGEQGSATPKDIAEATGLKRDHVRQLVRRMAESDQLDTDGAGVYFLPVSTLGGMS